MLTRAELLFTLCYEIPCSIFKFALYDSNTPSHIPLTCWIPVFLCFKPKTFQEVSDSARNRREIIREKDAFRLSGLTTILMTQTTKRKMMIPPVQSAIFPPIYLTFTNFFCSRSIFTLWQDRSWSFQGRGTK
jgi:hypothetical protein